MIITTTDFNLDHTLDCGQVFRWQYSDGWWTGVVSGRIVRVRQLGQELEVDSGPGRDELIKYFRLDDDMEHIYASIARDVVIEELIRRFRGLRLIRQEPWECLVSYMASSCKSIPNIKDSISNLCRAYGEDIGGQYAFPTVQAIAATTESGLRNTRLGFRAPNILEVARLIDAGELDLEEPFELDYGAARRLLMGIRGIGPKIADCVLLFAYDKLEAFPADTHILSIMAEHYKEYLEGPKNRMCDIIGEFARSYFGQYAGYAQQYLYYSRIFSGAALPVCRQ